MHSRFYSLRRIFRDEFSFDEFRGIHMKYCNFDLIPGFYICESLIVGGDGYNFSENYIQHHHVPLTTVFFHSDSWGEWYIVAQNDNFK